jgi:hypothetical protein
MRVRARTYSIAITPLAIPPLLSKRDPHRGGDTEPAEKLVRRALTAVSRPCADSGDHADSSSQLDRDVQSAEHTGVHVGLDGPCGRSPRSRELRVRCRLNTSREHQTETHERDHVCCPYAVRTKSDRLADHHVVMLDMCVESCGTEVSPVGVIGRRHIDPRV